MLSVLLLSVLTQASDVGDVVCLCASCKAAYSFVSANMISTTVSEIKSVQKSRGDKLAGLSIFSSLWELVNSSLLFGIQSIGLSVSISVRICRSQS